MNSDSFSETAVLLTAPAGGGKSNGGPRPQSGPIQKRSIGRPQKYALALWALCDDELYTATTVANRAIELNLIDTSPPRRAEQERQRIRIAMGRYVNNHTFPDNGDGNVRLRGQAPTPGWLGRRWKEHADPLTRGQYNQLVALLEQAQVANRAHLLAVVRRFALD